MVIPAGECYDAIRKCRISVGPVLGTVPVGGTSLSPGHISLPFKYLIHTCCSDWNGGMGDKVSSNSSRLFQNKRNVNARKPP